MLYSRTSTCHVTRHRQTSHQNNFPCFHYHKTERYLTEILFSSETGTFLSWENISGSVANTWDHPSLHIRPPNNMSGPKESAKSGKKTMKLTGSTLPVNCCFADSVNMMTMYR